MLAGVVVNLIMMACDNREENKYKKLINDIKIGDKYKKEEVFTNPFLDSDCILITIKDIRENQKGDVWLKVEEIKNDFTFNMQTKYMTGRDLVEEGWIKVERCAR